jgi:nitroimidazol reductase NimA-like FMN-containing flavoprotein (pyridoxamine 5'-phosphate oxidase superfamily)
MPLNSVDQWKADRAELEIRRWLYTIDQWAPEALGVDAQQARYEPPFGTLNHDEIDQVLRTEIVGRIGCHADGTTYVVPVTYVYDGNCVYGLTGEGMKLELLRANPAVCFEVDHIDTMTNWQSVIAWGRFEELEGEDAERALGLLVERVAQHMAREQRQPDVQHGDGSPRHAGMEGRKSILYRIVLTKRTGRFECR